MWHDNGAASGTYPASGEFQPGIHVENPETKRRLKNLLDAYDVTPELTAIHPIPWMSQRCLTFTRLNTSTSLSRNLEPQGVQ